MTKDRCVDEVRESLHGGSWELRVRCGMLARERIWMNVGSVGETLEDFVAGRVNEDVTKEGEGDRKRLQNARVRGDLRFGSIT